jgi:hypothetical protein
MQAKFTRESDFRQERDFGTKIGATFEFLGAHWRPLGKCMLYFVLPPAFLMGVALGIFQNTSFNLMSQNGGNPADQLAHMQDFYRFGAAYWLAILASLASYVMLAATVCGYVLVRLALPPEQAVTPRLAWDQVRFLAPRLLLTTLVVLLLTALGGVLLLVPGIYLSVALSLAWVVQAFEGQGVMAAISRNLALVRGKWWATLGLILVMSLLVGLLGMIFQLPLYVAAVGKILHWSWVNSDVLVVVSTIFSSVGRMILYTPLCVALLFQYFNLVERKEGVGLRTLVNSLGTSPAPVAYNQAYRPDDDGEY